MSYVMPLIRELVKAGYLVEHITPYRLPEFAKCVGSGFPNEIWAYGCGENEIPDKLSLKVVSGVMVDVKKCEKDEILSKDCLTVYSDGSVVKRQVKSVSTPVREIIEKCNLKLKED